MEVVSDVEDAPPTTGMRNQNGSYVPLDIENDLIIDQIFTRRTNGLSFTDYQSLSKSDAESPISVAVVLKTFFLIIIWYTISTFLTLYNKTLLGDDMGKFPAPLLMNTVHFSMQAALSKAITWFWSERFYSPVMSWKDYFARGKRFFTPRFFITTS
ncbi:PREDICTED: probable sugar phosphate/phosphate translocator At1g06470 [Erythranthe guttata]|uniref:probable sugar phosphate/phosphate translocator At1g06470 n=1 Tax=Erythranthe guttata TaxID=4155 RepID=UPI00064DE460|nr:PREDICTED: probable sugar phosphate/phosphate translocator At1g06470 [Erythranthe guttata]|eukprot:XP_012844851.1 PREDICTED: probable sugar phosphate/phosphate translocator At1g06470 [Erythranthe guttata]